MTREETFRAIGARVRSAEALQHRADRLEAEPLRRWADRLEAEAREMIDELGMAPGAAERVAREAMGDA